MISNNKYNKRQIEKQKLLGIKIIDWVVANREYLGEEKKGAFQLGYYIYQDGILQEEKFGLKITESDVVGLQVIKRCAQVYQLADVSELRQKTEGEKINLNYVLPAGLARKVDKLNITS